MDTSPSFTNIKDIEHLLRRTSPLRVDIFTHRNAQMMTIGRIEDPRTDEERDIDKGMMSQLKYDEWINE